MGTVIWNQMRFLAQLANMNIKDVQRYVTLFYNYGRGAFFRLSTCSLKFLCKKTKTKNNLYPPKYNSKSLFMRQKNWNEGKCRAFCH